MFSRFGDVRDSVSVKPRCGLPSGFKRPAPGRGVWSRCPTCAPSRASSNRKDLPGTYDLKPINTDAPNLLASPSIRQGLHDLDITYEIPSPEGGRRQPACLSGNLKNMNERTAPPLLLSGQFSTGQTAYAQVRTGEWIVSIASSWANRVRTGTHQAEGVVRDGSTGIRGAGLTSLAGFLPDYRVPSVSPIQMSMSFEIRLEHFLLLPSPRSVTMTQLTRWTGGQCPSPRISFRTRNPDPVRDGPAASVAIRIPASCQCLASRRTGRVKAGASGPSRVPPDKIQAGSRRVRMVWINYVLVIAFRSRSWTAFPSTGQAIRGP